MVKRKIKNRAAKQTIKDVRKTVIDINNKSKVKLVKDRPGHDNRYALDSNKIKKELKWKKNTNFSEGIKKTFIWYLNNLEYFKSIKKKDIITRLGQND